MHLYEQSSLLKNRLPCVFFFSDAPQPKDDLLHLRAAVYTKTSELPRLLLSLFLLVSAQSTSNVNA